MHHRAGDVLPFVRNLQRLGVDARVRLVDSSQFINRLRSFDFDMVVSVIGQGESPGNEQRNYWTSAAADSPAARNLAGIKDPVVDELVDLVITAPTRESLVARTRALDRVLLHGHYVIPNWHLQSDRTLYWNKFSRPAVTPRRGTSTDHWWFDADKAAAGISPGLIRFSIGYTGTAEQRWQQLHGALTDLGVLDARCTA